MIIDEFDGEEINGFNRYLINTKGQIYNTKIHKLTCIWIDSTGYPHCRIRDNNNKKHDKRVHRLAALTYIPNPNNLPQVNHIDGNKLNNDINNLEWCTNKKNTQHGYDNGLYKFKSRSYPINVYTKDGKFLKTYKSIRSMCEELPINRKTVTMILKGEKLTNNYDYLFEYVEESQETNESVA